MPWRATVEEGMSGQPWPRSVIPGCLASAITSPHVLMAPPPISDVTAGEAVCSAQCVKREVKGERWQVAGCGAGRGSGPGPSTYLRRTGHAPATARARAPNEGRTRTHCVQAQSKDRVNLGRGEGWGGVGRGGEGGQCVLLFDKRPAILACSVWRVA